MFDALTYQEMLKEIKKNSEKYGITNDMVAILITRPDLATGKDILNSLEYYHFRTGHSINFYLPGYGAYWTEEEYPDGKVVTEIAGVKWSFSNQRFVEFIEDMEKYSKWRYSGESDLIFAEVKNGRLSYERAMEFHLDNMLRDKEILEKALIKAGKKIIIVIDDIDRLANSQIRDVFQLVKQVADFPNVIYLLAMDREVVRRALTDVHNIDGNEYLEKIIQVPFELPELKKSKLHNIFLNKLDQIINDFSDKVVWDTDYWSSVFRNCVEPYINTLRDVNRMINTFQFRYGMLYKEIALEDMVGMTTLEVLEPELYKWICNNKEAVCGGFMHGFLSHSSNKPDYRNLYYDEFKSLGIDPDLAISCVSTMFPVFANDVNEYQYGYQPVLNIRSKMRIAYEGRFELYFMFDLDDIKVSRSVINACIYKFDRDVLSKAVEKINEEGNIVYFLEEIRSLVDKIPYKRLGLVASALLGLREEFKEENSEKLFTLSASDIAEYLMEDIIDRLKTEEEKYGIICSVIENVDITGLGIMTRFINRIELAYGRLAGNSEEKDKQIISLEHLKKLENIYVAKVRDIVNSGLILERNEFNKVFCLWKCFDKDGVEIYLKELFKTEVNKLKFICAMATKWSSTNGSEWSFYPQNYSEYISQDEVYNMIQGFDKSKLNQFTDIEQIKLASFVLNYNKNEMDHVDEQEVLNLISEWKTGKEE